MSSNQGPAPYSEAPSVNNQGPQKYPDGQPYMGQPYGGGGGPVIVMQQQQQQQRMQQQRVIGGGSGTSQGLCCLICLCTGGLSIPCWIWSCLC